MNEWEKVILPSALVGSRESFVGAFGAIYEHSPWVAEAVWHSGIARIGVDFGTVAAAMQNAVDTAPDAQQLVLLRAHPELASKAALAGALTPSSTLEQRGAGLDQCTPAELTALRSLNDAYQARFGFPFIIAVTGLTRTDIIAAMQLRVAAALTEEREEAMHQVHQIAAIRLKAMADAQVRDANDG